MTIISCEGGERGGTEEGGRERARGRQLLRRMCLSAEDLLKADHSPKAAVTGSGQNVHVTVPILS